MTRLALVVVLLTAACSADGDAPSDSGAARLPGGETTNTLLLGSNAYIRAVSNITEEHEGLFFAGNSLFNQPWVEAPGSVVSRDGLGPLFNARSCSACHAKDGRGRPPESPDEPLLGLLLRLSVDGASGPVPHPAYGSQLQPFAIAGVAAEAGVRIHYREVPGSYADGDAWTLLEPSIELVEPGYGSLDEVMISPRVAPAMIGLGLLEAIPASRIEGLADPDDADGDGISGRVQYVTDVMTGAPAVGRFGWKGDQPSIAQQVAGALLGDMGLTSPVFPDPDCTEAQIDCRDAIHGGDPEVEVDAFDRLVAYSSLLAVPVRRKFDDPAVKAGEQLFHDAGCAACHTPSHQTGEHAFEELAHQTIWPYTDLLLHDMGDGLADNRPVAEASGREWRTPPLWGLGLLKSVNKHERLLHDGRARGFEEAILWHGGEAAQARAAFVAMSATERESLVEFLRSL